MKIVVVSMRDFLHNQQSMNQTLFQFQHLFKGLELIAKELIYSAKRSTKETVINHRRSYSP